MKNLLKLVLLTGCAFLTLQACSNPLVNFKNSSSNEEQYQIKWEGPAGTKLFGSYVIRDSNNSTKPKAVTATLPHTLSLSAPKNSIVGVSGGTLNQDAVTIKIYRNGSECGKEVLTGSGFMANKVCQ